MQYRLNLQRAAEARDAEAAFEVRFPLGMWMPVKADTVPPHIRNNVPPKVLDAIARGKQPRFS